MKVAIMQPYLFPYIGYFQMISAVDRFVFYDDVNFIKRGWINRNRILSNGKDIMITVPLAKVSQNKLINEVNLAFEIKQREKMLLTIKQSYKKAPFFKEIISLIEDSVYFETENIANYSANSIVEISKYLNVDTEFCFSSIESPESKGMEKADRLIRITKELGGKEYINAIGGQELYKKDYFNRYDINLNFIQSFPIEYKQFNNTFVPWLSIIDLLMFNSKEEIKILLDKYKLL